jgi:succinate dehydrogenase/fumarate reductase flavoprotein subunit
MPECDVLVVGGGVAGLRVALAAHEVGARVAIVSKTHPVRSHTAASPGGLNAALSPGDSAGRCQLIRTGAIVRSRSESLTVCFLRWPGQEL